MTKNIWAGTVGKMYRAFHLTPPPLNLHESAGELIFQE